MHLDLTDLRLFLAVADAGSITGGAARAHLALAAASTRLRDLEAEAGVALLQRGRRGIRLTAAGLALMHHARLVLGQLAGLEAAMADFAGGLRGVIRLPANSAACGIFLPEALAPFLAAHPGLDVEPEEQGSDAVVRAVSGGFAELGIAAAWALEGQEGMEVLPFRTDRLMVALPRGHVLGRAATLCLADLLPEGFVGLEAGSALQAHLLWQASRLGGRMRLRVRAQGFDAACRLVAAGAGIAILPETALRRHGRTILVRPLKDGWAVRSLCLCARLDAGLTPAVRLLRDHLRG
ncbi:LysR family transcriptional regulator [Pseudoroseomonas globiformis]|uniref:LysR family transcriptional regulator n=1 Tax=Teichococcus globiformis TaxID=2307229 RepID=A0ABV7G608_9PROT